MPDGQDPPREEARATGESERPRMTWIERPGSAGSRRYGAAASPRPSGASLRLRRLPRAASTPPATTGPDRNDPDTARHELVRTVRHRGKCADRQEKGHGHRVGHCPCRPSTRMGTRRSFLTTATQNRSAESIFGTHPCARGLCRSGGPNGEGQAGARPERAANLNFDITGYRRLVQSLLN
jgi:hypothetical protein